MDSNIDDTRPAHLSRSNELVIVVPEEFFSDSATLVQNQEAVIDGNAIYGVTVATHVDTIVRTFGHLSLLCVHVNLPPTSRHELDPSLGQPVSLVEKRDLVVAGVFLITATECFKLKADWRIDLSHLEERYRPFLESIHTDRLTRWLGSNSSYACTQVHATNTSELACNEHVQSKPAPTTRGAASTASSTVQKKREALTICMQTSGSQPLQQPPGVEKGSHAVTLPEPPWSKRQRTVLGAPSSLIHNFEGVATDYSFLDIQHSSLDPGLVESAPTRPQYQQVPYHTQAAASLGVIPPEEERTSGLTVPFVSREPSSTGHRLCPSSPASPPGLQQDHAVKLNNSRSQPTRRRDTTSAHDLAHTIEGRPDTTHTLSTRTGHMTEQYTQQSSGMENDKNAGLFLAPSSSKQELVARLCLEKQIHESLMREAHDARDSLSLDPHNLIDRLKQDMSVRTPYRWDEISETAKHRKILEVVKNARSPTESYYAMGYYEAQESEENWVARWYLWHSFRYRDNRDRRHPKDMRKISKSGT